MTHVQGFDNLDEMFAAMAASEDSANRGLTPGQIRLRDAVDTVGYWAQALPEYDMVLYGVTPTVATTQESAGFDVADNRERGYLTGTAYSTDVLGGEEGDTHVSQVIPITEDVFNLAKSMGWPTYSMLREREYRGLGIRLAQAEQAASVA